MKGSLVALALLTLLPQILAADPPVKPPAARKLVPEQIAGSYAGGELVVLESGGRRSFVIRPTGKVDPARNWVWTAPFWLAIAEDNGRVQHRLYVEKFLAAGLHVAGLDVGTSCGSPRGAEAYHKFYEMVRDKHQLAPKARLLGQSNGGLISYAWAFRHPECVDRIGCIYPATDFRSWPKLPQVVTFPEPEMSFGLSLDELTSRAAEFNPIDNLAPLAKAGVRIFHIHGDKDELVPMDVNTIALADKYKALGGDATYETLPGLGHGSPKFYESESLIKFLTE